MQKRLITEIGVFPVRTVLADNQKSFAKPPVDTLPGGLADSGKRCAADHGVLLRLTERRCNSGGSTLGEELFIRPERPVSSPPPAMQKMLKQSSLSRLSLFR